MNTVNDKENIKENESHKMEWSSPELICLETKSTSGKTRAWSSERIGAPLGDKYTGNPS